MNGQRQNIQYSLVLEPTGRGETPAGGYPSAEPFVAKPAPESPAMTEQLTRLIQRMAGIRKRQLYKLLKLRIDQVSQPLCSPDHHEFRHVRTLLAVRLCPR
jgi:hypothetical protein